MKKYKPRMVKFCTNCASGPIRTVDTRTGFDGFYPGDEVEFKEWGGGHTSLHAMVVGYDKTRNQLQYLCENNWIWNHERDGVYSLKNATLIKRHGQKLIDNGEMRQI